MCRTLRLHTVTTNYPTHALLLSPLVFTDPTKTPTPEEPAALGLCSSMHSRTTCACRRVQSISIAKELHSTACRYKYYFTCITALLNSTQIHSCLLLTFVSLRQRTRCFDRTGVYTPIVGKFVWRRVAALVVHQVLGPVDRQREGSRWSSRGSFPEGEVRCLGGPGDYPRGCLVWALVFALCCGQEISY